MNKRGVAGLNIFLTVIVMLFMIGLVVMVYILAGSAIKNASKGEGSGNIVNESLAFSTTCQNTSVVDYPDVTLSNVVVLNSTGGVVPSSNYTISGGCIAKNE